MARRCLAVLSHIHSAILERSGQHVVLVQNEKSREWVEAFRIL